mgnify:CR=1 FL=1
MDFAEAEIKKNADLALLAEEFRKTANLLVEMLDVKVPVVAKLRVSADRSISLCKVCNTCWAVLQSFDCFENVLKAFRRACNAFAIFCDKYYTNGDLRIEGNSGSDGKGEWSEMEWACVEEG